jgi:hypothetical protein
MEIYDCLVTKLKAVVNDDNLKKFNHLTAFFTRPAEGYPIITITNGEKVTLTTIDGGRSVTLTGTGEEQAFDWVSLEVGQKTKIDISNISNVISLDYYAFSYNIGDFWSYRTEATLIRTNNTSSNGSIEDLGKLILLTQINISSNFSITGEVTTLAAEQVENGRESGTLALYFSSTRTGIKYNGETPPNNQLIIRFGSSMVNPTETDTANGYQVAMPS